MFELTPNISKRNKTKMPPLHNLDHHRLFCAPRHLKSASLYTIPSPPGGLFMCFRSAEQGSLHCCHSLLLFLLLLLLLLLLLVLSPPPPLSVLAARNPISSSIDSAILTRAPSPPLIGHDLFLSLRPLRGPTLEHGGIHASGCRHSL